MAVSPIRFSGMASGMDTDSIVKDMMRPQQYKIDMQKKEQALIQLRQDAWKDMNKKLYDFHTKFTHKMSQAGTFNNGVVTSSNESAISIASDQAIPKGTHAFNVTQLAQSATAVGQVNGGKELAGNTKISDLVGGDFTIPSELVMTVTGKEGPVKVVVTVGAENTLDGIASKMSEKLKDTGFTAKYDAKNGSFFISSTATGENQKIEFGNTNAEGAKLFKKLELIKEGVGGNIVTGEDAKYTYNGSPEFTSATNQIEINGIKATLKAKTTEPVTISSASSADATYAFVKEFVTEYNKLLDEINTKVGTKPGKNIQPLTAEERKAMSESDIKLWEDKLNSSLFYKDQQLTDFVNSARSILGGVIDGKSLANLGIVTGTWDEKGKLHIEGDEDDALYAGRPNRLKAALEKDPEEVTKVLLGLGKKLYEDHNKTLTTSSKLKSAMNFYNDKVMADKVKTFDKQILTLEDRMYKMEEMQYRKFAAMEKMLSSLNSQGSWLSQQFGG